MSPAKGVELGYVDEFTHGAIGLGGIEGDFALEAYSLDNQFGELANGELLAGAHIDVAVADFAQRGDVSATAGRVVTVHHTIGSHTVVYAGVLLYSYNIFEIDVQQHVDAGIGHILAPEELAEGFAGAPEGDLIVLDAIPSQDLADEGFIAGAINHVTHLFSVLLDVSTHGTDGEVATDLVPGAIVNELSQIHLTHHGRHHVRVLQVEIVVGAVEVGGHHGNVVGAVLQVIALAHLQAGNLGNGVLLIGVLQRAGEEAVLLHGLGRVLGVDARAAQEEQLLYTMGIGLGDDVALDLHVHHDEVGTVEHVGHDAAHKGSCQNYSIRLFFIKEGLDGILVGQVQLLVATANQIGVAPLFEVIPNSRTHKAIVACNVYLR